MWPTGRAEVPGQPELSQPTCTKEEDRTAGDSGGGPTEGGAGYIAYARLKNRRTPLMHAKDQTLKFKNSRDTTLAKTGCKSSLPIKVGFIVFISLHITPIYFAVYSYSSYIFRCLHSHASASYLYSAGTSLPSQAKGISAWRRCQGSGD